MINQKVSQLMFFYIFFEQSAKVLRPLICSGKNVFKCFPNACEISIKFCVFILSLKICHFRPAFASFEARRAHNANKRKIFFKTCIIIKFCFHIRNCMPLQYKLLKRLHPSLYIIVLYLTSFDGAVD